jgi:hypothetical protein
MNAVARDRAGQRKRMGRNKESEAPTGGPRLSATRKKKKRRRERWAVAGEAKVG